MLFERRLREGIDAGGVTVTFRRWRRVQAVAGRPALPDRKLKALGLTESLPVGYRLSPRGTADLTAPGRGR